MENNQKTVVVNCDSLIDQFEGNLYWAGVKFDYFYPSDRLCDSYSSSIKELFESEINERVYVNFKRDYVGISILMNPTDLKLFLTLPKEDLKDFFLNASRKHIKCA